MSNPSQSLYLRARAEIEKETRTLEEIIPALELADHLAAMFPELNPFKSVSLLTRCAMLAIYVDDQKQMVGPARQAALHGFHIKRFKDNPTDNLRRYFYKDRAGLQFDIFARLNTKPGAACRFEKVGVEEKPVFKLVCGK